MVEFQGGITNMKTHKINFSKPNLFVLLLCICMFVFTSCGTDPARQSDNIDQNNAVQQAEQQQNQGQKSAIQFSCYTYDDGGRIIQG